MIMELCKSNDQVVLPVFYDVNPSEIRNQTSSFGKKFEELVQRISPPEYEVSNWKTALADAGGIAGVVVLGCRDESEKVKAIVENVYDILHKKDLFVPEYLVGVDNRLQEVITMFQNHQSKGVIMVGVWGIGGIGKTTIAKALYNEIGRKFESRSYLSKIRKVWDQEEGQVRLQKQLLYEICKTPKMKINSIESGKSTLRDRLRNKKALVVLDDVDTLAQLNALGGSPTWFGEGSRIIITTRDLHLLRAFQVDLVYSVRLLSDHESLQLFKRLVFNQASPEREFIELSRRMVVYAEGLPLALEVLASFLCERSSMEWESALRKLSTDLPPDIYNQLKLSFDSLDGDEREIFINIVLFYIGEGIHDVIQKLDGRGCNASIGIRVLEDRSLVTIDKNNKLRMHNLLQLMGRQIIRESSQNELLNQGHGYEVFLSCRGDTRATFTSKLYKALCDDGISAFKDDVELPRGNRIKMEILQAIRSSKISIIIFSREYAASKWCLEELSIIMEFRKSNDQAVLPVFYAVDPSEIRNQASGFGEAFKDLIQKFSPPDVQVSNWRTALAEAGGIVGITVLGSWDESEQVKAVVANVCDILHKKDLFVPEHLVGVGNRVQEVIKILQAHQSEDVIMVGIWGIGGIGKTTIAKVLYNEIGRTFESRCCLLKIREVWIQKKGEARLQKQLLSEICKITKLKIHSIESGKSILRDKLRLEKALVVLDDVDTLAQLNALVGSRDWFGRGSRIIITTRDLHLLQAFKVDHVYSVKLLSEQESLQLFKRTVFKHASPEGEFIELSRRMVAFAEGLPLALEVLASFLSGWSLMKWESALRKLSTDLPPDIYNRLKLSFDPLDSNEKEIFINIVLFYIGEDKDAVIQKLDGHVYNAIIGIRALVDRSLVTIDNANRLRMHNLLQLMGRQIIHQSSRNELLNQGHSYEVFLSFGGEDTRGTFISHLFIALCNAGITVFKDDVELHRGNHMKMERLQAIGSSKIAIIIFSREYAATKQCLEELSIIMGLYKSNDRVVLPVCYDVHPSEIRNQNSSFGEAFKDLIRRISPPKVQVSRWKTALSEAGSIAGIFVLSSRNESEDVKAVVENVCDILDKKDLFVIGPTVGLENRVQEVISMFQNHQSEDVVMVGIWGMGGIGKSTIAKALYNEIGRTFESRSYLSNIREVWGEEKDQVSLQNQLLSQICKTTNIKINSIQSGKSILRDRLCHKKALIVLDDVDESTQLKALVGGHDWFKPGSIIIITTRNQRLLHEMDCCVYVMKNLDESESVELFSWHAFRQETPKEDFTELSRNIVAYSGGLPLALEVLGCYLFGREAKEWESLIPSNMIHEKLKICFDGLDDLEKEIFLDISCFFIGMDRNKVTQILNGCGLFADIGIKTLVERSLVTIDKKNKLSMHDLLRDMGREIIHQQSHKVEKRSRLWFHEDALVVLVKHMGTEYIEGLSLKLSQSEKMDFQTKAFKKMTRLRLLHLDNVQLTGDYRYISRELRWLCWHHFPLKYIPTNFYLREIVVIDLKYSSLIQVWKEPRVLKRLKILNLSHSPYLVQTPDFSKLPNLEKLILKDCPSLSMIHHSIGLLHRLLLLDLENCIGLRDLPRSIYRLKCLKTLILSGCVMVEKLEEDIEQMDSLSTLIADNTAITRLPFSSVRSTSIGYISLCGYEGHTRDVFPSLIWSWMSPTNNPLSHISTHVGMPSSILWDKLNSINVPSTIPSSEPKQQNLLLEDGLETCSSLRAKNCMDISKLENCLQHLLIQIGKNTQVFRTLSERVSQGLTNLTKYNDDCVLPSDNYPYWLTYKGEGTSIKFKMPPVIDHLKGMTICSVCIPSDDLDNKACGSCIICLTMTNYTKTTTLVYTEDKLNSLEEEEMKEIISNLQSHDQVEVKTVFGTGFTVKKTAVYLIYNESFDE